MESEQGDREVLQPDDRDLDRAMEVLHSGGTVAFPTETVYGLGADASNPVAVNRIFDIKGRPTGHPLIVHLGDSSGLEEWALDATREAHVLARTFWPGPLTMILRRSDRVVDAVTGGRDTVGLRVPDHPVALALLRRFGGGIAAPSANRFGKVSPTTAEHVKADLGDSVDVVLDGGACEVGVESTILDLSGDAPEILRPGGISGEQLSEVLGRPVEVWTGEREVVAPGTLASHYSPEVEVEIIRRDDVATSVASHVSAGRSVGVLAPDQLGDLPPGVTALAPAGDPDSYARVLYRRLREADTLDIDVLLVVEPEGTGIGGAVRDRLKRAAVSSRN